jgi:hypothetical protein
MPSSRERKRGKRKRGREEEGEGKVGRRRKEEEGGGRRKEEGGGRGKEKEGGRRTHISLGWVGQDLGPSGYPLPQGGYAVIFYSHRLLLCPSLIPKQRKRTKKS